MLEDETDTRDLLSFLFHFEGAIVATADNVPDALEALKGNRPDVVVADIGLPEYNGYAFIAALRREENVELRTTPVIALTAFATPADRDTALVSGFDAYLAKPFDPAHLIATIKQLHERRVDSAA